MRPVPPFVESERNARGPATPDPERSLKLTWVQAKKPSQTSHPTPMARWMARVPSARHARLAQAAPATADGGPPLTATRASKASAATPTGGLRFGPRPPGEVSPFSSLPDLSGSGWVRDLSACKSCSYVGRLRGVAY